MRKKPSKSGAKNSSEPSTQGTGESPKIEASPNVEDVARGLTHMLKAILPSVSREAAYDLLLEMCCQEEWTDANCTKYGRLIKQVALGAYPTSRGLN